MSTTMDVIGGTYTQSVVEGCINLLQEDENAIWMDIKAMPEDTDQGQWKKKFESIRKAYTYSSRFSLMRFLFGRAKEAGCLLNVEKPEEGFFYTFRDGSVLRFMEITQDHAQELTEEELHQYADALVDMALREKGGTEKRSRNLIECVLEMDPDRKELLQRSKAMKLGHLLRFSVSGSAHHSGSPEMERFLLAVFDDRSGFQYGSSADLIDYYGFLMEYNDSQVQKLQKEYAQKHGTVPKNVTEEKPLNWTADIQSALPELVIGWQEKSKETCDKQFMDWMGKQAPKLDLASRTALTMYRNLAVFLCDLYDNEKIMNVDDIEIQTSHTMEKRLQNRVERCLMDIAEEREITPETRERLYGDNGEISEQKCRAVADRLLKINADCCLPDASVAASQAYRILTTQRDGTIAVRSAQVSEKIPNSAEKQIFTSGKKAGKEKKYESDPRISQLLMENGKFTIGKADMLYLVWLYEMIFLDAVGADIKRTKDRIWNFCGMANDCLNLANLPGFYPPHLMEQSMLLSIACSAKTNKINAGELYDVICSAQRKSKKK